MATKAELIAQLEELGVEFNKGMTKAELEALLEEPTVAGIVNCARLNIRKAPSMEADVVRVVTKGEELEVLGTKHGWCELEDGSFCVAKFLDV